MNDDVTALCNLPYILFSQVSILAPLHNFLILTILVINWQANYNILNHMSPYLKY